MTLRTRGLLAAALGLVLIVSASATAAEEADAPRDWSAYPMASGPFEGTWESLERYECPAWFRDAKFGIWAIVGPQCVPLQGDWYARHMYVQGHRQHEHHVKTFGHASKFGYKDLIEKFNPEKLDYDRLVGLYKQAGARYAVILAVHHDNFDLWDSKHHEWNSVQKGPKRDLVGEFRDAAAKHGLRFGVTTHLARSYSWFQTSHGADKTGPMAGVPYDGADPKYASLYHPPFAESSGYPAHPPEAWQRAWYLRVKDLIDQYQPDLMYFDGEFPFDDGAVGRRLVGHYYNVNSSWHDGRNDAAMCVKLWNGEAFRADACVQDIERGRAGELRELPWQTDTCIGGWYYQDGLRYKTAGQVVHMLIDIVSKNGNLLLNIPVHPSGTIDAEETALLEAMGPWMAVGGEGIYETRPWVVFGEGPTKYSGGHFRETAQNYTARDFRFTARGDDTLYAFFMAWPADGRLLVRSLAAEAGARGTIERVELLGREGPLVFKQGEDGLAVELPDAPPCEHAWALMITGRRLRDFQPQDALGLLLPDDEGKFVLDADAATIHGSTPRLEQKPGADKQNLGHWGSAADWVAWRIKVPQAGAYDVTLRASSMGGVSRFAVALGESRVEAASKPTSSWEEFVPVDLGRLQADKPGIHEFRLKPMAADTWKPIGLLDLTLSPAK